MSDDRIRPCGCVVCVCEDEMQCHGCGAKACEAHDRIMNPLKYPSSPHALTREQCSLCTANRPRLCDQHYKQGADELLKHVTAAIQDQQTPGGVKATYEQLLELCNQQRQALAQQAQEVERLKLKEAELGELKLRLNCPMLAPSCLVCGQVKPFAIRHLEAHAIGVCGECRSASQQLAAMTAERDAFKAVLQGAEYEQVDKIGTLSIEVAQRIGVTAAHRTKEIVAQLAASQQRVRELEVRKDGAYLERNHLVAALARCFPSGIRKTAIEGWSDDWHGCVYIDLPAGQISYHYHDSQAFLFESLPAYGKPYDGHTKDDVHDRLKSAQLQATLAAREAELEAALAEQRVLDSKYVDERAARFKAQDEADQYYKCLQIEKGEHATALAERDTARHDAARLREALEAHMQLAEKICYAEPELSQYRAMTEQAQRALKGNG